MKPTPIETKATETKPTKELSFGAKVGRLITKLSGIDADEQAELAQSPAAIKAKYQARREAAMKGQGTHVVEAARRATVAGP